MATVPAAGEAVHALSVDDYHRMVEVGILDESDRVELVEGILFEMSPEGPAHADVIARLARWLTLGLAVRDDLLVRVQSPVTIAPSSEPEPDLAVVHAAESTRSAHPVRPLFVIEVAQTSLGFDRGRKAGLYAAAAVPEYWIVDLVARAVHRHCEPSPAGYRLVERVTAPATVSPERLSVGPLELAGVKFSTRRRESLRRGRLRSGCGFGVPNQNSLKLRRRPPGRPPDQSDWYRPRGGWLQCLVPTRRAMTALRQASKVRRPGCSMQRSSS